MLIDATRCFDRTGFQEDHNVVLPIDRLNELAAAGEIGAIASIHYSFMGATHPDKLERTVKVITLNSALILCHILSFSFDTRTNILLMSVFHLKM